MPRRAVRCGRTRFLGELVNAPRVMNEYSYNFSLFGEPSATQPWGWSLFGHHLCLNCFVLNKQMVLSPDFIGAEPNCIDCGPYAGLELFQDEERIGLELMRALPGTSAAPCPGLQADARPGDAGGTLASGGSAASRRARTATTGSSRMKACRCATFAAAQREKLAGIGRGVFRHPAQRAVRRADAADRSSTSMQRISAGSADSATTIRSITASKARSR